MKSVTLKPEALFHSFNFSAYLGICKLKVVVMLVITAWVGLMLAPDMNRTLFEQGMSLIGIGLLSASAAAINHVVDREIDKKMARTRHRPLVQTQLSVKQALGFAALIGFIGAGALFFWSNTLTLAMTLGALVGYAVVYTMFLKRATPQNIVIGGLAGAMPPLLGWISETGQLNVQAWLLVMIIFIWTPPHFWALAIARRNDYKRADIPMLPVTHGSEFTRFFIVIYSILLCVVCLFPYLVAMSGNIYLLCVLTLNSVFLYKSIVLYIKRSDEAAMALFHFSITYLLLLFISLFIDRWIL
jgi:protoheme IX farnesyltransferase